MELNPNAILKENESRVKNLFSPYDPLYGIGSLIDRVDLKLDDQVYRIPYEMSHNNLVKALARAGGIKQAAKDIGIDKKTIAIEFLRIRIKYDFEFWTSEFVYIRSKTGIIMFVLNKAQRKFLAKLEEMRLAGIPIRIILLKARQWGGSTLVEMYIAWLQLFHVKDYNSMIVADVKDQARHISGMYDFMAQQHRVEVLDLPNGIRLVPYMHTQNYRMIEGQNNIIGVASVENPEAPRAFTWQLLHLSELGSWKSTAEVNAENLAASLMGGLVDAPYTLCVKESTAKGVGNYFHREWLKAVKGDSNDIPIFVSWLEQEDTFIPYDEILRDKKAFSGINSIKDFINSWNDYDNYLWSIGACIEQIAWRRKKRRDYPSETLMMAEHPTTPEEAFQSTGHRVFSRDRVAYARSTCKEPLLIGNIFGDAQKGKDAFKNIRFEKNPKGLISIWTLPGQAGIEKDGKIYTNRYCAFGDVGGRTEKADYSTLKIMDRIWTLIGGVPTIVAQFRGHIDQDLFAWQAAQLCYWYDRALLAVEVNSLRQKGIADEAVEPEHSYTVLDEIKDYYPNLFYRIRPETVKEHWDGVVGFHTNRHTKAMIIDKLNAALRDQAYEERCELTCNEMDCYEFKPDQTMGATEGNNDDLVIADAGVNWLSDQMDPVREVDAPKKYKRTKKAGFGVFS